MHCLHILLFEGQLAEDIKIPQEISFKDNITSAKRAPGLDCLVVFVLLSFWGQRGRNVQYQPGNLMLISLKKSLHEIQESSSNKPTGRSGISWYKLPGEHQQNPHWKQNISPEHFDGWFKQFFLLEWSLFRMHLFLFRGGIYLYIYIYIYIYFGTLPKANSKSTWTWMVGIPVSFWVPAYFQGLLLLASGSACIYIYISIYVESSS